MPCSILSLLIQTLCMPPIIYVSIYVHDGSLACFQMTYATYVHFIIDFIFNIHQQSRSMPSFISTGMTTLWIASQQVELQHFLINIWYYDMVQVKDDGSHNTKGLQIFFHRAHVTCWIGDRVKVPPKTPPWL